jgi:hypothetical protein
VRAPFFASFVTLLVSAACSTSFGLGRKPAAQDGYPDYNRLEFRRKIEPNSETSSTTTLTTPPVVAPQSNLPSLPDAPPRPPPAAVPVPSDDSEPVLPDDMLKTLTPGSTGQVQSPTVAPAK